MARLKKNIWIMVWIGFALLLALPISYLVAFSSGVDFNTDLSGNITELYKVPTPAEESNGTALGEVVTTIVGTGSDFFATPTYTSSGMSEEPEPEAGAPSVVLEP